MVELFPLMTPFSPEDGTIPGVSESERPWREMEGDVKLIVVYISRSETAPVAYTWGAAGACIRLMKKRPEVDLQLFSAAHHLNIADKREDMCTYAYLKGADAVIMIDDDMALRPDSLIPLYDEWRKRGKGVYGALYTGKSPTKTCMFKREDLKPVNELPEVPSEVYMLGTGVMLIDTDVVADFVKDGTPLFICHYAAMILFQTEDYYFTEACSLRKIPVVVVPPVVSHVLFYQSYPQVPADEGGHVGGASVFIRDPDFSPGVTREITSMSCAELTLILRNAADSKTKAEVVKEFCRRRVYKFGRPA